MKTKFQYFVSIFLVLFLSSIILAPSIKNLSGHEGNENTIFNETPSQYLVVSGGDNRELLDSLFNAKVLEYYDRGYFPQVYEPSLQATYYALYTLHSIEKLHEINQTKIIEYIMDHYEDDSTRFMDTLAYRYLDTDFMKTYFPLSTVLEVTCYAILSLELLDALDLLNIQEMIDFIWSCHNPTSGGFIGQPYDAGLEDGFKVATADNTYFAVITLDLLMDDWLGYSSQKDTIISFINGLQNPSGVGWASGGFDNDENKDFNSLLFHAEPNLLSSYYCIKTLEVFGMVSSINEIGNATLYYQSYRGFSLLSEDYTSMNLINTIISSFDVYNRISELDIQQLYRDIRKSYNNFPANKISRTFFGYLIDDTIIFWFRSHPIEYYTSSHKNYIHEIDQISSHQSTYYALDSLKKLFKLDDFADVYDLMNLVNDIAETQFLNTSYYDNFGSFSSFVKYSKGDSQMINNKIYCDYTYYAIKCLELLGNYLGLNFANIGIDIAAVYTYIDRNLIETPTMLYFNPKYASDIETILKTTYYMAYVLEALNLYNKNSQKIENYIEVNLNYSNIKNIYYSYKLSELLNLEIEFNFHSIQALIQEIFSEQFNEFYLTPDKEIMDQEIFSWICDMARTSEIGIEARYADTCPLGGANHMEVSLYNLILRDFGTYITFKFESDQLGSYIFSKLANSSYIQDIPIPVSSNSYPTIEGYLRAYEGTQIKAEHYISFTTNYSLEYKVKSQSELTGILFEINASICANRESFPTTSGSAFAKVYKNGEYLGEAQASHQPFSDHSTFSIPYSPQVTGEYIFELYLDDGISGSELLIASIPYNINEILRGYEDEVTGAIPLMVIFLAVPGTVIVFSTKQLNKVKKESENS